MARHENTRHRRAFSRDPRPRLLVVCGSRRTESLYLEGLRAKVCGRAVDITIVNRPRSPRQVVEYAAQYAEGSGRDFDERWCVVDVDEFDIDEAASAADKAGIRLAVSNPCFEYWLLLHHEDCRAPLDRCTAAVTRLKKHLPAYDKADLDFAHFGDGLALAVKRATALAPTGTSHRRNPSSSVWQLVEKMMEQR